MIPSSFDYHAPGTLAEAIALLARLGEGAKVLSGGQSLLPLLKLRLGAAEHLVDIGRIPGLEGIREEGGLLKIGRAPPPAAPGAGPAGRGDGPHPPHPPHGPPPPPAVHPHPRPR